MNKLKLKWLQIAISVTLVFIAIPLIYYYFGREHYPWQQNAEINKISVKFKNIVPYSDYNNNKSKDSRVGEAWDLFPIIKIGMSAREVRTLLGKPSQIRTDENGKIGWLYYIGGAGLIIIEISNDKVVEKSIL